MLLHGLFICGKTAPPWTAKRTFRQTLSGHQMFGAELLDFENILIDVHRYTEAELLRLSNVIGSVFLMDQSSDADLGKLVERLRKLVQTFREIPLDMQQRFFTWFANVIGNQAVPGRRDDIEQLLNQWKKKGETNMASNLERSLAEMFRKTHQEGIEQGIEQGIEKGIEKGIETGMEKEKAIIAGNLIAKGMDNRFIAEVTGLSFDEIDVLRINLH